MGHVEPRASGYRQLWLAARGSLALAVLLLMASFFAHLVWQVLALGWRFAAW